MRRTLASIVLALFAGAAALAAAQKPAPKPGPEHQKLGYFVGTWSVTGELKPSPFGPGGKTQMTETCEWFDGRFSLVCRSEGTSPLGPSKGLAVMGYNAEEKVYTYYGVDNSPMNMASVPKGTIQGDTWTFNDEGLMGGRKIKSRFVITASSPASYAFKWEIEEGPGKWSTIMQGTSTKRTS